MHVGRRIWRRSLPSYAGPLRRPCASPPDSEDACILTNASCQIYRISWFHMSKARRRNPIKVTRRERLGGESRHGKQDGHEGPEREIALLMSCAMPLAIWPTARRRSCCSTSCCVWFSSPGSGRSGEDDRISLVKPPAISSWTAKKVRPPPTATGSPPDVGGADTPPGGSGQIRTSPRCCRENRAA